MHAFMFEIYMKAQKHARFPVFYGSFHSPHYIIPVKSLFKLHEIQQSAYRSCSVSVQNVLSMN